MQHTLPQTQFEQMYHKNSHTHILYIFLYMHTEKNCSLCISTQILNAQPFRKSVCACVCHSGCSPTHSSLGWPPPSPSSVRCCCLAAGLNTAHCVSAPSQPQTVPTNVLLIRWLNYSCKNNVDISLKIAVCQILLANLGPQPLLSNSSSDPSRLTLPPSLALAPPMLFLTLVIFSLPFPFS